MQATSELALVCPNSERLISKLFGKTLVLKVQSVGEIPKAFDRGTVENRVLCIVVDEQKALSAVHVQEEWKRVPILLHVPELGSLKKVLSRARQLRDWNIRVFMPGARAENLTSLRILSSLGISAGLTTTPPLNWDAVSDLMHYAIYTRTPHGDIDPFGYVKLNYNPQEFMYLQTPWFENPLKYVHIDEEENIALSSAGLKDGTLIGRGLESLAGLRESTEYRHSINSWQGLFLEDHRCAYCPAWRLCQGTYVADCEQDPDVYRFFEDFMAAADASYAERQGSAKWQP
jgi:hypothetical protein